MNYNKKLKTILPGPVFLYGSGRSGTTWLEERIANALNAEVVFEPLNEGLCDTAREYAFKYLSASTDCNDLKNYIERLIGGELNFFWTRYRILPDRLAPNLQVFRNNAEFKAWVKRFPESFRLITKYRSTINRPQKVIKLIRANLMLEWLVHAFPQALHIAIVRHPVAVIESRMRLDRIAQDAGIDRGANDWDPKNLLMHYTKHQLPNKFKKAINDIGSIEKLSPYEHHCLVWCLESKMVFDCKSKLTKLIYYEDIIDKNSPSWGELADILNIEEDKLKQDMEKPSQQSSGVFKKGSYKNPISKLKSLEGESVIKKLQEYLDFFDISQYRADRLKPEYS